jgi:hypothetical protein
MKYRSVSRGHGKGLMSKSYIAQLQRESDAAEKIAKSLTRDRVTKAVKALKKKRAELKKTLKELDKAERTLAKLSKSRKSPSRSKKAKKQH